MQSKTKPQNNLITVNICKTTVHPFVACRLDYCNTAARYYRLIPAAAVRTECCCPPDHGYTATGSHHSGSEGSPSGSALSTIS